MLQTLPNELIREIIYLSDQKSKLPSNASFSEFYQTRTDLLSLCLTCKLFRQLALELLYSDVRIDGMDRMHQFLRSILRDGALGSYVRSLQLTWKAKVDKLIKKGIRNLIYRISRAKISNPALFSELEEIYQAALDRNIGSFASDYVKARSEGATAIVLLSYLPNLMVCTLEPSYIEAPPLSYGLINNLPFDYVGQLIGSELLNNVQTLRYKEVGISDGSSIVKLIPFLFLPSVCSITAEGVYIGHDFDLPKEWYGKSSVRTLHFRNCNVYARTFSQFLQIPRTLEGIVYERNKVQGNGVATARDKVIESLFVVSETLEYLRLTWYRSMLVLDLDDTTTGSLAHFTSLNHLDIDIEDLLGSLPGPDLHLVDFLPPNLKELQLGKRSSSTGWKASDYLTCVRELLVAKLKTTAFPKLKRIATEIPYLLQGLGQLSTLAAEAGVEFGKFVSVVAQDGIPKEEFMPMEANGQVFGESIGEPLTSQFRQFGVLTGLV